MWETLDNKQLYAARNERLFGLSKGCYPADTDEELDAVRELYEIMAVLHERKSIDVTEEVDVKDLDPLSLVQRRQVLLQKAVPLGICLANMPADIPERRMIEHRLNQLHEQIEAISVEMKSRRDLDQQNQRTTSDRELFGGR